MSTFARRLLPLAIAATVVPAFALAQKPDVYGTLHVSADVVDADTAASNNDFNVSSNASLIGLRSTHKLDDNLTLFWQVEATIPFHNGGNLSADRDSFVGFRGDWGQVRVGQFDTPFKILRNRTDLFGNALGDARNIVNANGGWDRRLKNGIEYATPKLFDGVVAKVHYSNSPNAVGSDDTGGLHDSNGYLYSAAIEYTAANFYIAAAHDKAGSAFQTATNPPTYADQEAYRLAGYVDVTDSVRVTALYQTTKSGANEAQAYGAGVRVKVSDKVAVKGQYYTFEIDNANDDKASLVALGAEYYYAKPLTFYANVALADNDASLTNKVNPWNSARSNTSGAGENPTGISLGAIYRF